MAKKQHRKGFDIRESESHASSQRMSLLAHRGGAPLLDSNARRSCILTTDQYLSIQNTACHYFFGEVTILLVWGDIIIKKIGYFWGK